MGLRHIVLAGVLCALALPATADPYPWLKGARITRTLEDAVPALSGFKRTVASPGSFAAWLRHLPMKAAGAPVKLYDGRSKFDQQHHAAVIDIDTGAENLQQCADAVMRLRAEYLLAQGRARDISFNYTNGKRQTFPGGSYDQFRRYMRRIFSYAGSYSLEREMQKVPVTSIAVGDVFIQGGFPGHAVLVIDMAENAVTGEKRFLLMQSFMPAQDMHVLKNPHATDASPWYPAALGPELVTPEWIFKAGDLRRFKN